MTFTAGLTTATQTAHHMIPKVTSRSLESMTVILVMSFIVWILSLGLAFAQANSIIMGFSGAGISTDLRRVIEKENLCDKYGGNVKAMYSSSGNVLTQAMADG